MLFLCIFSQANPREVFPWVSSEIFLWELSTRVHSNTDETSVEWAELEELKSMYMVLGAATAFYFKCIT